MIAYVEAAADKRWLVVLDERGDEIYRREVVQHKPDGVLAPIVSGETYDAQRPWCRYAS